MFCYLIFVFFLCLYKIPSSHGHGLEFRGCDALCSLVDTYQDSFKNLVSYNWDISSWTSTLTAVRKPASPTAFPFSGRTGIFLPLQTSLYPIKLSMQCLPRGGKQWEREADHAVRVGDIRSDWNYLPIPSHISRALCLIKHINSTKFVFTFLILSSHLCLGPSQNYSLRRLWVSPATPFINSFVFKKFANLMVATVISLLFSRPSAHPNGTTGLPQDTVQWNVIMGYGY